MSRSLEEELLDVLSSPFDFSVARYLNLALTLETDASTTTPLTGNPGDINVNNTQARLAELALQLQFQTAACHEEIGKLGAELRAIVPRCYADVGRIQVGLTGLQQDASALQQASQNALLGKTASRATISSTTSREETNILLASSSLETLSTLHALQSNLSRTREILTAAATWDETLAAMPALLAGGAAQLPTAVEKLAILERGEAALRGMPDPAAASRTLALTKVRTQVSNLLQPQLAHALQTMQSRLGPLQQCVTLYAQLGMLPKLQVEYVKHRPASLHKLWFDYQPPVVKASASATTAASTNIIHDNPLPTEETASAFADWLPTWFEAVLQVLQEERRQAATVFGQAKVAILMVDVLREAIRPILSSFHGRLKAAAVSLHVVGRVYNSTLQFLSLAYDLIATVHIDYMESQGDETTSTTVTTVLASGETSNRNVTTDTSPLALWRAFESVVVDVLAKPLQPFQIEWPSLEETQVGQARIIQARTDLQKLLARVQGLEHSTTDELWQWLTNPSSSAPSALEDGPGMIALVQQALQRFRLLRGGFGAQEAVNVLDGLLSKYVQEITKAIHAWSEAAQATQSTYEDSHVLVALSMLRVAGWVQLEYNKLQDGTRQEFKVLKGRLETHERFLETLPRDDGKNLSYKFTLPDSLSTVDINAMMTLAACTRDAATMSSVEATQNAINSLELLRNQKNNMPQAQKAITTLGHTCHAFVFNVCFAVPRLHLASLSSLDAWKKGAAGDDPYGTLPQPYITQVGEHVLSLVQALEPFAADKASLVLVQPVMSNLRHAAMQPWKELLVATELTDFSSVEQEHIIDRLMDGKDLLELVVGEAVVDDGSEEEAGETPAEENDQDEESKAVTAFCNAWLDVVGVAVTGRLLERIFRIPTLTPKGCEHLQADLNYLVNVLMALGVQGHPHPLLGHFAELSVLDLDVLRERIEQHAQTREPLRRCLLAMERRLVAMRE